MFVSEADMHKGPKRALITGITGQAGGYLAELLLEKGYAVHGLTRRPDANHMYLDLDKTGTKKITLHYGDLIDSTNIFHVVNAVKPHEIYNLGAMSHVVVSYEMSEYTAEVDGIGTLRLLNAIRSCGLSKFTRFYQAATSELFGRIKESPQNELTPFYPRSVYGIAKLYAYWMVAHYRETGDMFCCNGILFNHESPRRGKTFVTRKITRAVASIKLGKQDTLFLGNLDAKRDWGHARDYVEGMWRMLQADEPDDFVLATGVSHTVRDFVEKAFKAVDIDVIWQGESGSIEEQGVNAADPSKVLVKVNSKFYRPTEENVLVGDPQKVREKLGWTATTAFDDIVKEMVYADLADIGVSDT